MFKFSFDNLPTMWTQQNDVQSEFSKLLQSKWDRIHNQTDVFRYKLNNLHEKIIGNKYLLQLNPDRGAKRRYPDQIDNITQPFDPKKFNFTKVSSQEIMFDFVRHNSDVHMILVNVSPISRYHSLLCPSIDKKIPQIATKESLMLAIEIMFLCQDRDLRIGFNSLCALASVNHLHYHLLIEKSTLPVEEVKCQHIKGFLYRLDDTYPIPAFCLQVKSKHCIEIVSAEIFKLIQHFLSRKISHNLIITRGKDLEDGREEVIRIIIWPRKSSYGVKQLTAFNIALCELSGWFPVYSPVDFENLQVEDIENELKKWKVEKFKELCTEIKSI